MRRHSRASGEPARSRRPKSSKSKGRSSPKAAGNRPARTGAETEVAELRRELHEAREQQTAASEVLRVISNSASDLQPVFEAMLDNAMRICDAMAGGICRWDGNALHHVALKQARPAFTEIIKRAPIHPNPETSIGRMLVDKTVVHVSDLAAQPAYLEKREPGIVTAVEVGHLRTVLAVPMLRANELYGAIILAHEEVRPFTDKQIDLIKNFAAQAVIAIENARLLSELRQSLEQQTATADVLQVVSSSLGELEPVFAAMLEKAVRVCDAKFGSVYRCEGDTFRFVANHNSPSALAERARHSPFRPSAKHLFGRIRAI